MNRLHDDDELAPPSPEALQFLKDNDEVGTPTPAELRRVRERVLSATEEKAPPRRAWLPPEVWAVAAVVLVAVVAQLVYLSLREGEPVATEGGDAFAEAWLKQSRADGEAALAKCDTPQCRVRGSKMLAAMTLKERIGTAEENDLKFLETFDEDLSRGARSPIAEEIAKRRRELAERDARPKPAVVNVEAEALFNKGRALSKQQEYDEALEQLETCVSLHSLYPPCWRQLGSVAASLAARDRSVKMQERARQAYTRYLELAPPEDPFVPRIAEILEAAPLPGSSGQPPAEQPADASVLRVALGTSHTLQLGPNVQRIAIGDPEVADVRLAGGGTLQVIGAGRGKTTVLVWFTNGTRQSYLVIVK